MNCSSYYICFFSHVGPNTMFSMYLTYFMGNKCILLKKKHDRSGFQTQDLWQQGLTCEFYAIILLILKLGMNINSHQRERHASTSWGSKLIAK